MKGSRWRVYSRAPPAHVNQQQSEAIRSAVSARPCRRAASHHEQVGAAGGAGTGILPVCQRPRRHLDPREAWRFTAGRRELRQGAERAPTAAGALLWVNPPSHPPRGQTGGDGIFTMCVSVQTRPSRTRAADSQRHLKVLPRSYGGQRSKRQRWTQQKRRTWLKSSAWRDSPKSGCTLQEISTVP